MPSTSPTVAPRSHLLDHAIRGLVHGFAMSRSRTHPCLAERVGPVWRVYDGPRRRGNYRNEEWMVHGVAPEEVDGLARKHSRGRYAVCAIAAAGESDEPLRRGYKALGYRLGRTEPMMAHALKRIPRCQCPAVIQRVKTAAMAERLGRSKRSRPVPAEHLCRDSPVRHYVAVLEEDLAGWRSSVDLDGATWCSGLYVKPVYRRRGIGRALMARMLRDDRAAGAKVATLTASHTGALLYPTLGYQQAGTLLLYIPPKRKTSGYK